MHLQRKHKLLMLFLSPENPLLGRIVAMKMGRPNVRIKDQDIPDLTGMSRETPKNWRKGKDIRDSKIEETFETTLTALRAAANDSRRAGRFDQEEHDDIEQRIRKFKEAVQIEEDNLYDAARILGMTIMTCQQTLDRIIYDAYPLLSSAHYAEPSRDVRTPDLAEIHRQKYEGVYLAYVRRHKQWLQGALRVRYLLESGGGRFLRCKLNFPILTPDEIGAPDGGNRKPKYFEYDGFIVVREENGRLFWSFEKRQPERNDLFHFITNATPSNPLGFTLIGRYLTTGQDAAQSIESDAIMLRKLFTDNDPLHLSYRDVMWKEARVLTDPAEIEKVNREWLAAQPPKPPEEPDDFTT